MQPNADHRERSLIRCKLTLLLVMLFVMSANVEAFFSDAFDDETPVTQHEPIFDDSERDLDLDLPAQKNRFKTHTLRFAGVGQEVVKRVLKPTSALLAQLEIAEFLPYGSASIITSVPDLPFRPPRVFPPS